MLNLYHVWRSWPGCESIVASFLIKSHAKQFLYDAENLNSNNGARFRIEDSRISTYGMAEETRREVVQALNVILIKESKL